MEAETARLDIMEATPPAVIFGEAEVEPVLTPTRSARVWSYGDLCTVGLRATERGTIHVRVQSSAVALWTSHAQWIETMRMLGEDLGIEPSRWRSTRVDVAVDVEGLDVTHTLLPYIVGHRGSIEFKARGRGRQIEIGNRAGAKRFLRIYLKSAMDCSAYMPTWTRQGYAGGRVVRVEVEFKNGGLPSRDPDWYSCAGQVRALFGDAVKRYRVATRLNARSSRSDTHPAWLAICDDATKWVEPPDPVWTWRQRFELSRKRASKALGSLAGRIKNPWYEMAELDETLELLRGLQHEALSADDFDSARAATVKRENLLEQLTRGRRLPTKVRPGAGPDNGEADAALSVARRPGPKTRKSSE